jgi:6-phosphogluconolactonase
MKIITKNAEDAVNLLCKKIQDILKEKKYVVMGLPGGRSIKKVFQEFSKHKEIPWKKIHIFMVDERIVHIDSKESNFFLLKKQFGDVLIKKNLIPEENLHPFIINDFKKDYGVSEYGKELQKYNESFDVVILGVGEDGHVAGLFPDHTINNNEKNYFYFDDSPKLPKKRMTASRYLIENSKTALIIFLGEEKRDAYENFKDKTTSIEKCPAKIVKKIKDYIIYTDLEN